MKKILSVAMATAMVASMATVAFAATVNEDLRVNYVLEDAVTISTAGKATGLTNDRVPYGKTMYFAMMDQKNKMVFDNDYVKSTSIKAKWDQGRDLVESMTVVKKKAVTFENTGLNAVTHGTTNQKYYYFVAIQLKAKNTTDSADLIGDVTLRKSGDFHFESGKATDDENTITFDVNVEVVHNPDAKQFTVTDTLEVFDFEDGDVEQELRFSKHDNDYFIVDTCDQADLLISVTDKYNSEVAAKHPEANLHFFNGNGATFNRMGELTLAGCDLGVAKFVYELKDGVLVPVKAEYDSYEEAFKVKTRTLGVYVLSDSELKLDATSTPSESKPESDKTNPGTGAIA